MTYGFVSDRIGQIETIASNHAGYQLVKGCAPWLRRHDDDADTRYVYDWVTIEVLDRSEDENVLGGPVETGVVIQELQLRAPNGEVLARFEKRRLKYRQGDYPVGDYTEVTEV